MMATENQYQPDFVTPPGFTLEELLCERGISQAELAERTGLTPKTINEIIKGKAPLTHDSALLLERVLGVPAHFWNNRERQYREYRTRLQERERLKNHAEWLRQFPVRAMVKLGWLAEMKDGIDQARELLNFFGVAPLRRNRRRGTEIPPVR